MKQLILIVLLVMFSFKSFSQFIDLKENTYWADAGLGLSSEGILTGVSINYVQDGILYKLRFNVSEEFILFGPRPAEISFNSGVLYGKLFSHRFLQVQFSGGVGLTWGTIFGNQLQSDRKAWPLPEIRDIVNTTINPYSDKCWRKILKTPTTS